MSNILFIASEGLPYVKSGGLADVIGSLPSPLLEKGHDVRVILPLYKSVILKYYNTLERIGTIHVQSGNIYQPATYYKSNVNGVIYYFIEHQHYFERDNLYGYVDDGERFSFFQKSALCLLGYINYFPDVIHTHDWHTGMIPLMCKVCFDDDRYSNIKHVYTIHNLAFQGNFPLSVLTECLGISDYFFNNGSVRFDNGISFMKSAIIYADKVTTVSNTYAHEILTEEFGERMQEVLKLRQYDLWGILNGIDTKVWNPKTDSLLSKNYDINDYFESKKVNKLKLQEELGLNKDENVLVIGIVSRLTNQKGVYLILDKINEIMNLNVQFVVLGTGEKQAEDSFKWVENAYKGRAVYYCGYNENLAHLIYAGSDLFLMPSLYEPCGIGQLIALRYGTLPLVRETGGLKDTVNPCNVYTKEGNGFSFNSKNSYDMFNVLKFASDIYYFDLDTWNMLVVNAFNSDVSWDNSANIYEELYKTIV